MYRRSYSNEVQKETENHSEKKCHLALTVDETAEELCISRPAAYELVRNPDFPAFRIGKRILVNRSGLQRWMDRKTNDINGAEESHEFATDTII